MWLGFGGSFEEFDEGGGDPAAGVFPDQEEDDNDEQDFEACDLEALPGCEGVGWVAVGFFDCGV